jgi:hypothetical protein
MLYQLGDEVSGSEHTFKSFVIWNEPSNQPRRVTGQSPSGSKACQSLGNNEPLRSRVVSIGRINKLEVLHSDQSCPVTVLICR